MFAKRQDLASKLIYIKIFVLESQMRARMPDSIQDVCLLGCMRSVYTDYLLDKYKRTTLDLN